MAHSSSKPAPLYITKDVPRQNGASASPDVTSYFDLSPKHDVARDVTPVSASDPSPGSEQRPIPPSTSHRPYFRFHSDYEALHKIIHGHTIEEGSTRSSPGNVSPLSPETPRRATPVHSFKRSRRRASLQSSESSGVSSSALRSRSSRDFHTWPPRLPKVTQIWGAPTSFAVGGRTATKDTTPRRPSTLSESVTVGGDVILVRTDQTPLKPPQLKSAPEYTRAEASSIKIETEFTGPDSAREASHETLPSEPSPIEKKPPTRQRAHQKAQSPDHGRRSSSLRSSISPKHIFSTPLSLLSRVSMPKRTSPKVDTNVALPFLERRPTRMPDHRTTQLKRNYTADALQRVTSILQDMKPTSQSSLLPPQIVRPLTWKTFSERVKKEPKTAQGILSGLASHSHMSSREEALAGQSYTSSPRDSHHGAVPANTPVESATYKIKRSPSADTEEFLKIDISVRGGTSYLPSEARRIHTPPLPEEGAHGRWKGFFFDYNAPRRPGSLYPYYIADTAVDSLPDSGAPSPDSVISSDLDQNALMPNGRPKVGKSIGKNKRILTGDWVDVKLAEIDSMGKKADSDTIYFTKDGTRRLNSPDVLSKTRVRMMYEGEEVEPEMFDLTIPEHLPSSPLCPRHPRYWRVVERKGSPFRGCWMHGVGLNEDV